MTEKARIGELQVALMLLTRFPAGQIVGQAPGMAASSWAWPIAGAVVGVITAAGFALATAFGFPHTITAIIAAALGILATGGMHEDGLADLADGFGGGSDRDRKLEIMRDSRIGSYGVLALIVAILLRVAAMVEVSGHGAAIPAIIALAITSRAILPVCIAVLPPARENGLGHGVTHPGGARVLTAIGIGLLSICLLPIAAWVAAVCGVLVGAVVVSAIAIRQIGGQTGDVLGAIQLSAEICGWLALVWYFS